MVIHRRESTAAHVRKLARELARKLAHKLDGGRAARYKPWPGGGGGRAHRGAEDEFPESPQLA